MGSIALLVRYSTPNISCCPWAGSIPGKVPFCSTELVIVTANPEGTSARRPTRGRGEGRGSVIYMLRTYSRVASSSLKDVCFS